MTPEELAKLVENLPQADSLDLYRLGYIIRSLYSEPKRVAAARARIHLGMTVEYFSSRDGVFHRGRIVRTLDDAVTIDDTDRKMKVTGVPYAALKLEGPSFYQEPVRAADPMQQASAHTPEKMAAFRMGDRVSFTDHGYRMQVGTVVRVNAKSVSVAIDHQQGHWRVSPALLTHLIDA